MPPDLLHVLFRNLTMTKRAEHPNYFSLWRYKYDTSYVSWVNASMAVFSEKLNVHRARLNRMGSIVKLRDVPEGSQSLLVLSYVNVTMGSFENFLASSLYPTVEPILEIIFHSRFRNHHEHDRVLNFFLFVHPPFESIHSLQCPLACCLRLSSLLASLFVSGSATWFSSTIISGFP